MAKDSSVDHVFSGGSGGVASEFLVLRNHRNVGTVTLSVDVSSDEIRRLLGEYLDSIGDHHPLRDTTTVTRMGSIFIVDDVTIGYGKATAADTAAAISNGVVGIGSISGDAACSNGDNDSADVAIIEKIIEDITAYEIRCMSPSEVLSLACSGKIGERGRIRIEVFDEYVYMLLPDGVRVYDTLEDRESALDDGLTGEILIGELSDWVVFLFAELGFGVSR